MRGRVQQVQAPLDVGEEIEWRYRTGAGGGEFERERHPVERAAQCDDRVVVSIECGTRRSGAVREELHRVTVVERFDNHHLLARDPQRLAARRDDTHVVARLQQPRYEAGNGVEHVFTVVEHDDRRAFGQRRRRRRDGHVAHLACDRGLVRVAREPAALDNDDVAVEMAARLRDEPGLANSTGSGDRDERDARDELDEPRLLVFPPDEGGDRRHATSLTHEPRAAPPQDAARGRDLVEVRAADGLSEDRVARSRSRRNGCA